MKTSMTEENDDRVGRAAGAMHWGEGREERTVLGAAWWHVILLMSRRVRGVNSWGHPGEWWGL